MYIYVNVPHRVTFLPPNKYGHVCRGGSPILWRTSMTQPYGHGPEQKMIALA